MSLSSDLADLDDSRRPRPTNSSPVALQGEQAEADQQRPKQNHDQCKKGDEKHSGILENISHRQSSLTPP
jgi:hypothetical protein